MNFNVNDNPLLVAPQPVRVTGAHPHFTRSTRFKLVASPVEQSDHVKMSDDIENIDEHKQSPRVDSTISSDKDSPRASPRCVYIFRLITGACEGMCCLLSKIALCPGLPCHLLCIII
jgi:hypothetical protein